MSMKLRGQWNTCTLCWAAWHSWYGVWLKSQRSQPQTCVSPSADSRRAVVSNWLKYVHEVLVNCFGGLSLPRKSVVRLTHCPNMTVAVYHGRKTTTKQHDLLVPTSLLFLHSLLPLILDQWAIFEPLWISASFELLWSSASFEPHTANWSIWPQLFRASLA